MPNHLVYNDQWNWPQCNVKSSHVVVVEFVMLLKQQISSRNLRLQIHETVVWFMNKKTGFTVKKGFWLLSHMSIHWACPWKRSWTKFATSWSRSRTSSLEAGFSWGISLFTRSRHSCDNWSGAASSIWGSLNKIVKLWISGKVISISE